MTLAPLDDRIWRQDTGDLFPLQSGAYGEILTQRTFGATGTSFIIDISNCDASSVYFNDFHIDNATSELVYDGRFTRRFVLLTNVAVNSTNGSGGTLALQISKNNIPICLNRCSVVQSINSLGYFYDTAEQTTVVLSTGDRIKWNVSINLVGVYLSADTQDPFTEPTTPFSFLIYSLNM